MKQKIFIGKKWEKIKKEKEVCFFIGRPSVLGNPFFMKDETVRNEVCDKYQVFFNEKIKEGKDASFFSALKEISEAVKNESLERVVLGCFCHPKRCHGETIKSWVLENLNFDFDKVIYSKNEQRTISYEEKQKSTIKEVDYFVPKRRK